MPLNPGSRDSTNGNGLQETTQGLVFASQGVIYRAWSASNTLASSTDETSVMATYNASATSPTGFGGLRLVGTYNNAGVLTGWFPGALIHVKLYGTITNTGTPNLTTKIGTVNPAGTFAALGDTTATAMTTISGTGVLDIDGYIEVLALTGSNNVRSWVQHTYNTTTVKSPRATFTLDLSAAYYDIDVRCTWSANSASNSIAVTGGYIEVL